MAKYYGERRAQIDDVLMKLEIGDTVTMDKQDAQRLIGAFQVMRNKGYYPASVKFRTRYIDGMTHITCISKPV